MPSKKTTPVIRFYVGRKLAGSFVRDHEELPGEDFSYHTFSHDHRRTLPIVKLRESYDLVVGPFLSEAAANVFCDVEGINTVSEAEARADRNTR